jgi:hypothetical protein
MIRKYICWFMVIAWPVSLLAADSGAAMLHSNGKAWINGALTPASAAVFPGDLVQTESDAAASLSSTGSSVAILPGSLVKFESRRLGLDHGSVAVATSQKLATRAGSVTITPTAYTWTEFQVSEKDGRVMVVARKGDVSVQDESGTSTVAAGERTTRYFNSSDRDKGGGAVPAGGGGLLDSPLVIGIGGAAVITLTIWALLQSSKPFSPSNP